MDHCRPLPWDVASKINDWGGKDQADLDDLIATKEIKIIHKSQTNDGVPMAELSARLAMTNRRVYGNVAEIHESDTTLNTRTPYRLVVVIQLCYHQLAWIDDSWFWAKTSAFSSNVLLANAVGVQIGTPVCGILAPTYGTHLTTQLEFWPPTTWGDWSLGGIGGIPKPYYIDLDPYTYDWLPTIGGIGYGPGRLRWALPSVRIKHPSSDVREFHREIAQKQKEEKAKPDQKTDPGRGPSQAEIRKEAKKLYSAINTHGAREESVLDAARNNSRQPGDQGGRPTDRRSRNPQYLRTP